MIQAQILLDTCKKLGYRIMTVESMTGGGICNALTSVKGYSDIIFGGLIVYHTDAKIIMLGDHNMDVYSLEYAKEMCIQAFSKYNVDVIISITGNANFIDSQSIFYVGISLHDIVITQKIILEHNMFAPLMPEDITREMVKNVAIESALLFANTFIY